MYHFKKVIFPETLLGSGRGTKKSCPTIKKTSVRIRMKGVSPIPKNFFIYNPGNLTARPWKKKRLEDDPYIFRGELLNFRGVLGDFNETRLKNMRKSNWIILGEFGWVGFGMGFSACWLNHPSEKYARPSKWVNIFPNFAAWKYRKNRWNNHHHP